MSFSAQIITVFISSPGDVGDDRKIVLDELQAWNQRNGRARGCYLSPLTWEDLVAPDVGNSAQDVINVEVGDDYDVFLGLMWARFGSPTKAADSGTQEEFERALARRTSGELLRISFLFKKSDLPIDQIDPDQLKKVQSFKAKISEEGAYYAEYSDDRELVSALAIVFDRIANEKQRYLQRDGGLKKNSETEPSAALTDDGKSEVIEGQPDGGDEPVGLFDLEDELEVANGELLGHLAKWGDQFNYLTETTTGVTQRLTEISQFGQPDRKEVRKQISIVTQTLTDFSEFGRGAIDEIELKLDEVSHLLSQMIIVATDFDNSPEDIEEAKSQFVELVSTISGTSSQISDFINSLEAVPRLDRDLIKARDSVIIMHKRLRKRLETFAANMRSILDSPVLG